MKLRPISAALAAALLTATLASCSAADDGAITIDDPWIKATNTEMTSMFGVLHNSGADPVTLTEVRVAEADLVELHTMVDDGAGNLVMTAVEGGFTVGAGQSHVLEPGADHIMLMELATAVEPGMYLATELIFDDGTTITVEVPAKEFLGADENYHHDHEGHDEHDD